MPLRCSPPPHSLSSLSFLEFFLLKTITRRRARPTRDRSSMSCQTHSPHRGRPILYRELPTQAVPAESPQVAKTYHELQTRKECQGFVENMNKDKADYFLLLPHGGGKTAGRFLISKATCWPRGSRCAWKVRLNTRAWQLRRIARPTRPHNRHKWQLSAALDRCASI